MRVPLPRVTRDEPRFLTHDQVEHLAEAAGDDGDVIRLLAYTGLRFGEMAALRVRRFGLPPPTASCTDQRRWSRACDDTI